MKLRDFQDLVISRLQEFLDDYCYDELPDSCELSEEGWWDQFETFNVNNFNQEEETQEKE